MENQWSGGPVHLAYDFQMPAELDLILRLRLDEIREERGWTQEQMASAIGKDPGQVAQWERGSTGFTRDTIRQIALALDLNAWELVKHPASSDPEVRELVRLMVSLSPAGRRAVLAQASWARQEGLLAEPDDSTAKVEP